MPDTSVADKMRLQTPGQGVALFAALRAREWIKSAFVLAPLLFGGRLGSFLAWRRTLFAAACFSLAASAGYILNDLLDLEQDRVHPLKRFRPLASGRLGSGAAVGMSALLVVSSLAAAYWLSGRFALVLLAYLLLSSFYSLKLKQVALVDALTVAVGFVLRVVAGAVVLEVEASHWLLLCTFLLSLFLAFSKRRYEIASLTPDSMRRHRAVLHDYSLDFLDRINSILLGATLVCYALYTTSTETVRKFGTDQLIYTTPLVIYGILRYYLLTQRQDARTGNPSEILTTDGPLILCVTLWAAACTAIIYRPR